jgi:hypothetical protein
LGVKPFVFKNGYVSDQSMEDLMRSYESVRIVHLCKEAKSTLKSHLRIQRTANGGIQSRPSARCERHKDSSPSQTLEVDEFERKLFRASTFLQKLQNKQLSFYGDSIGRQIFLDLVAELNIFQTEFSFWDGDKVVVVQKNSTVTSFLPHSHRLFSKRIYAAYNATILYFDDGRGLQLMKHAVAKGSNFVWYTDLCKSDVIVVGMGAWFKPWFAPRYNKTDYYDDMRQKRIALNETMWKVRTLFSSEIPRAKIIWRLNSHAGMIDELSSIGQLHNLQFDTSTKGSHRHSYGHLWGNLSNGAVWPMYYNELYAPIAVAYNDFILDYWRISVQYLTWVENLVQASNVALQYSTTLELFDSMTVSQLDNWQKNQRRFRPYLHPLALQDLAHYLDDFRDKSVTHFYPVMSDSLHYCPGTVPRAGAFALHGLLDDVLDIPLRNNGKVPLNKDELMQQELEKLRQQLTFFLSQQKGQKQRPSSNVQLPTVSYSTSTVAIKRNSNKQRPNKSNPRKSVPAAANRQ